MTEAGSGSLPGEDRLLRISQQSRDGALVVKAVGDIDLAIGPDFTTALDEALHSNARRVVVDLLEVTFMGTVGLAALVQSAQTARRLGASPPVVVARQREVLLPIQIAALDTVLEIGDNVDEAITR